MAFYEVFFFNLTDLGLWFESFVILERGFLGLVEFLDFF